MKTPPEDRLKELEAGLIEQDHRFLPVLLGFFQPGAFLRSSVPRGTYQAAISQLLDQSFSRQSMPLSKATPLAVANKRRQLCIL